MLFDAIKSLFNRPAKRNRRRPRHKVALQVEQLEDRLVPTVSVGANFGAIGSSDNAVAVGPTQVLEVVNGISYQVFNKATGALLMQSSLPGAWDARAFYSPQAGRFVIDELGALYISKDSNLLDGFGPVIAPNPGGDYNHVGFNADAIVLEGVSGAPWVVPWANPAAAFQLNTSAIPALSVPAMMEDASPGDPMWLLGPNDYVYRVDGLLSGAPSVEAYYVNGGEYDPHYASQVDYRNGMLAVVDWGGNWKEISTQGASPSLYQSGVLPYSSYQYGGRSASIAIAPNGSLGITWDEQPTTYVQDMYVTGWNPASDLLGELETPVEVAAGSYVSGGVRIDFSGTSVDPTDGSFWGVDYLNYINFYTNSARVANFSVGGPAAPTNLAAIVGNAQVALTWTASSGATSYDIYRGTASGGETLVDSGITSASFTDTGLTNGTTYYYEVGAVNGGGESLLSSEISATPQVAPPAAPTITITSASPSPVTGTTTNLSVGATDSSGGTDLTYTWTVLSEPSGVSSPSFSVNGSNVANNTTASFHGAGTYTFEVAVSNAGGTVTRDVTVTVNQTLISVAVSPTRLSIYDGQTQQFTAPGTDQFGNLMTPAVTWSVTGVGTVNSSGLYTAPSTGTGSATVTASSGGLTSSASVTTSGLIIAIDAGGPATGFFVADTDFSGSSSTASTSATIDTSAVSSQTPQGVYQHARLGNSTYTIPNLTPGTAYGVSLDFADIFGSPAGQRVFNVSINGTQVLSNFDIVATAGGGNIAIAKQFSTTANSSGQIVIQFAGVTGAPLVNGIEISGAVVVPAAPTNLVATAGNAQVALTWTASYGATSYDIYRGTTSGGETLVDSGITATSFNDTGLANGTTYYYEVTAVNGAGPSPLSSQVSATPLAPPPAPTNLVASPGNAQVALTWTASSGATSYDIYRGTASGGGGVIQLILVDSGITATSFNDTGLANGTTYYYIVTAVNSDGVQSGRSNEVSATPTGTKVTPTVTWAAPAAITYGTPLSTTQLDATAGVPGTFVYTPAAGTVLGAGTQTLNVIFTPTDTTDYTTATDSVTLTVNKATPTITWAAPAAITYGTALGTTQLDASASVPGTFVYAPAAGTVLGAGTQTLTVTFTPTDTTDYTTATDSVMLTVNPASSTGTPVSLTSAFNRVGIVTNGTTFGGGFDGGGSALSANLLGSSVSWNSNAFNLGAPNTNDVISAAGQVVSLPAGSFTTLNFLAGGVYGNQANQVFTVTYTDGTTQTFTQSISDWYTPQNYSGESKAVTMAYRDASNGTQDNRTFYAYGYSFALNSSKTVQDITLPNNGNVEIVAMTLAGVSAAPTGLTATPGNAQVALTWSASTGATSYNLYRSTSSGGETLYQNDLTSTSFTDTVLTNGTTYYYEVTAVNSAGESAKSSQVSATPQASSATPVSLTSVFNRTGIVTDGSTFGGGFDGGGAALSANLLGSSVSWNSDTFNLGAPNTNDVISAAGQVISLPAGSFTTLNFLAAGVYGNQANQVFTVTYADGTTQTFTQSISDWYTPQNYSGESKAVTMAYRDVNNGAKDNRTFYVYGYSFALNSSKTVQSITLPNSGNVEVLAMTLATPAFQLLAGTPIADSTAPDLTVQQLSLVEGQALAAWQATGALSAAQDAALHHAQFVIANLPLGVLGETIGNTIYIDNNAAGYGWSLGSKVIPNEVDLLTVVEHELGHVLGLADLDPQAHPGDLMDETLGVGVRRSPSAYDISLVEALPGCLANYLAYHRST